MKKLLVSLISIFSLSLAMCQNPPAPAENKDAPEISFVTEMHDFGNITLGSDGTYNFEFKNTGKEPLVLSDVRSSCGCTTPEWPRSPIKKGEKAVIKVKYNTNIPGPFTKSIYVTSNAKTNRVELKIKGFVANNEKGKNS